jgi:hypothetical protein
MIYIKIQVFRDHEKLVNIFKLCIILKYTETDELSEIKFI